MNVKTRFLWSALLTGIGLILFLIPLNALPLFTMSLGDGISLYNLLIDIAAGVFTVWGLYWAASEFSEAQIKPDLRLIVGAESEDLAGIDPLVNAGDALVGRDSSIDGVPVSQVTIGLFLENDRSRAAQFVRVTLRVRDVPRPWHFSAIISSFKYRPNPNTVLGEAVFLQFGHDLLVYKGDGVQLGNVRVAWPRGSRPDKITLVAGLYSLPGELKEVIVTRPVRWREIEMVEGAELSSKNEGKQTSNRLIESLLLLLLGLVSGFALKSHLVGVRDDTYPSPRRQES